jgi:hypothetical protein
MARRLITSVFIFTIGVSMQACSYAQDFIEHRENNSRFDRMERRTRQEQYVTGSRNERSEQEKVKPEIEKMMRTKYAYLIIKTIPSDISAWVYVDTVRSYDSGQASRGVRIISDTNHVLEVRAAGFKPCSFHIHLKQEQKEVLKCELVPDR